jgi:flagellar capping protein FliD
MEEGEREQNKRINQHQRLINDLRERLKTIEIDVEPDGRISEAFEALDNHLDDVEQKLSKRLDDHDKKFDRLEHKVNQLGSKLDIIIEHLTNINDLPEE